MRPSTALDCPYHVHTLKEELTDKPSVMGFVHPGQYTWLEAGLLETAVQLPSHTPCSQCIITIQTKLQAV